MQKVKFKKRNVDLGSFPTEEIKEIIDNHNKSLENLKFKFIKVAKDASVSLVVSKWSFGIKTLSTLVIAKLLFYLK